MDDIQRLILQVQGKEEVDNLRKAVESEEDVLRRLIATHGVHDPAVRKSAQTMQALTQQMRTAEQAAGLVQNKLAGTSQQFLQFGRIAQDFQAAGMAGIVNNFEGMAQAMGLGAGAAGMAQLLGVALYALTPQIKELWKSFAGAPVGIDAIEKLRDRIKELEDKKIKLGVEVGELDVAKQKLKELEAGVKAVEAAKEGKTVYEKEAGKQIGDIFDEAGPVLAAAVDKMVQAKAGEMAVGDPAHRQAKQAAKVAESLIARTQEQLEQPGLGIDERSQLLGVLQAQQDDFAKAQNDMDLAMKAIRKNAIGEIGALMNQVRAGNKPAARPELAGRLRQAGAGGLANVVEETTPEEMQRQEGMAADFARQVEQNLEADKVHAKNVNDFLKQGEEEGKKQRALAEAAADQAGKRIGELNKTEDAAIKSSGVDLMTEQILASLAAAGGAQDRAGRFHPMDEQQQLAYTKQLVENWLSREIGQDRFGRPVRANADMSAEDKAGLAGRITAGAQEDLGRRVAALSGTGMSNTQKLLSVSQQNAMDLERIQQEQMQQAQMIDQLQARTRVRRRTAGKRS